MQWHYNIGWKATSLLSSIHKNQTEIDKRHKGYIEKPSMIQEYNVKMGEVDKYDQHLSYYYQTGNQRNVGKESFKNYYSRSWMIVQINK